MPAAGLGRRFAGDRPKQYAALGARPVIAHVISKLAAVRGLAGIVAAVAPADPWWREVAEGFDAPVVRVDGGAERRDSVANALEYLRSVAADDDLVMVHDAVRPCVTVADVERVVAAARRHIHGAVLAAPVCDTLKRAGPEGSIADTVDRSRLWRAFTPPGLPSGPPARRAQERDGARPCSDRRSAGDGVRRRPPAPRRGLAGNIKITRPEDLALARALLGTEEPRP